MYLGIDRRANVWYESIDSMNAIITTVGDFCKTRLKESSVGGTIGNTVGRYGLIDRDVPNDGQSRDGGAFVSEKRKRRVSANDTIPRRCVV